MSFLIYRLGENGRKQYLVDIPAEDNPLGGIGYRSMNDESVPCEAGTCPTEDDAKKLCAYLRTAFYGPDQDHFYIQVDQ